ncbi:RHS repeat-associated core domain-containing protein [Citrobacter portucalensis]|uniref:RHS repeat-associated core domain-containing protein n=1 Tax=Citrobacter portucalensis TaxID=1639133 RepID=UPI003BF46572
MSGGKPAARMGDMTKFGGPIAQGSMGVMIGAPTGVACSVCPGGVTYGSPVNPLLGAKVLPGETDFALPGPLPFVLTRAYSSYRTRTPAPAGIFGPGWKAPFDIRLQIRDEELILNDNGGRSIHFEHLLPGEVAFSRSERFWFARGGVAKLHESHPLHRLWQALPEDTRLSPHQYLAANSPQGPWWILGWPERVPAPDEALPAPLPPYRVLTGLVDSFGRRLSYHRDAAGPFSGHITGVTDGAGRRFRLVLKQMNTLPATRCGQDDGVRLGAVWLTHDPEYPDNLPAQPLVHYDYSPRGELAAVYDRGGVQVRRFDYAADTPGRMVAHQYPGRPQTTYRYDAAGRVVEQHNPAGLSYRYEYGKNAVTITDSLHRREVLHTEGEGGLKRVVKKEYADGSVTRSEYSPPGWLTAQTDAAGRKTEYRYSIASGNVTEIIPPDGRKTVFYYNGGRQLTGITHPDGLREKHEYDEHGRLTGLTSRQGSITRYVYDDPHSEYPSASEDATGSKKQMVWSRHGQLLSFTDCSGYETRYDYDRFGQVTAIHQEEGLSQYRAYDTRGRLVSQRDAAGRETHYEYSEAGDLTAVITPDGNRTETQYDAGGRPVSITAGGLTRRMQYDAAGRVTQLTNENGSHTEFTYDALDRLTQQSGFDGRTQQYDYDLTGKRVCSKDEDLVTRWYYDESDRLTHRTVNGEPAEQWQYNERGWLAEISHLSEGHRVAVHYGYDEKGRLIHEQQVVHHPETDEPLWQHETRHDYSDAGLAHRMTSDKLPAVEWLTYGSGYLAGMKSGSTPLIDFTRDRLHRETQRRFGEYTLTTGYSAAGQLLSRHLNSPLLNHDYGYDGAGHLTRISTPRQTREYDYSQTGRLTGVRMTADGLDIRLPYATDPAGNRLPDPELYPDSLLTVWPDNRIVQDAQYLYRYDRYGRLTEKTDRIPDGAIRMYDERTHRYSYDNQHRLVHYLRTQYGKKQAEGRYLHDPLGRRIGKQVWKREREHPDHDQMALSHRPYTTWYGWDGDRLTTTQTAQHRVQTIYEPGSFTPLIRVETATEELDALRRHRTLAEKLRQEGSEDGAGVVFPPALVQMLDRLEGELRTGVISDENRQWLAGCGLTPEQMAAQMEPLPVPKRTLHLYHCDHRGLPLALISLDGGISWRAEYDEWGNVLQEDNPHNLQQLIRLPGQQYDDESGLHYNRHRYYNPGQGRYITQDPIGLEGGWNLYTYPLNPVTNTDPLGLTAVLPGPFPLPIPLPKSAEQQEADNNSAKALTKWWSLSNSAHRPVRSEEEENQADVEYNAYKQRCEQKPESNLSRCAAAIFEKNKREDCLKMRSDWDDKWYPGRHDQDIQNEQRGLRNAIKDVINRCKPTNGVPR